MRSTDTDRLSRRDLLKAGAVTLLAVEILPGGRLAGTAWAAEPKTLDAKTFATLVQMSRDLYPHDRLADRYYAAAVAGLDEAAGGDAELGALLTDGVAELDRAAASEHGDDYAAVPWEDDRIALIEARIGTPFVQKVRGNLITGLYNNKEVWALFGYEGESASKGGYIDRGFNDLDWL